MQTHTWDISNCFWGELPAQRMTCGTTWLENPCCRTPTSFQTPLGYKDNIALGRLQKNNQGCTIFTASRIKTNFKYTLHTNLLSRRHFEAVPESCAQSLPVAASVTAALKIPAQFDKLLLSPSSRGNTALQRRYSTAMSPLLPRYVPGVGGPWFTLTGALR